MAKELERLNPHVQFDVCELKSLEWQVFGTIPGERLALPDGYYYNDKNGITNKHNTATGLYECFDYEYDVSHFA